MRVQPVRGRAHERARRPARRRRRDRRPGREGRRAVDRQGRQPGQPVRRDEALPGEDLRAGQRVRRAARHAARLRALRQRRRLARVGRARVPPTARARRPHHDHRRAHDPLLDHAARRRSTSSSTRSSTCTAARCSSRRSRRCASSTSRRPSHPARRDEIIGIRPGREAPRAARSPPTSRATRSTRATCTSCSPNTRGGTRRAPASSGDPVPDGFVYGSDTNDSWLTDRQRSAAPTRPTAAGSRSSPTRLDLDPGAESAAVAGELRAVRREGPRPELVEHARGRRRRGRAAARSARRWVVPPDGCGRGSQRSGSCGHTSQKQVERRVLEPLVQRERGVGGRGRDGALGEDRAGVDLRPPSRAASCPRACRRRAARRSARCRGCTAAARDGDCTRATWAAPATPAGTLYANNTDSRHSGRSAFERVAAAGPDVGRDGDAARTRRRARADRRDAARAPRDRPARAGTRRRVRRAGCSRAVPSAPCRPYSEPKG